jgi:tetratricopeptide (TPR) repeat protein
VKRAIVALLAVVSLIGTAVVAERALQGIERADPLGRKLLFLPSAQMLRLASLGNAGLMADALYLWSIQYYGQYEPHERFLYLEPVYQLITDLDPLYHDAYRVGALIMQLPNTDEEANKQAVIRLFDKALRNMPDNYEIAETAGWDLFIRYRDKAEGIRYFKAAAGIPGAPVRIKRFLVAWEEDEEGWSIDDAISYWTDVRDSSDDDYNRAVSERQIYRLIASRDKAQLNPLLEKWKLWHGRCPETWAEVVDSGFLSSVPVDYFGNPYLILAEDCTVKGADSVRFD